MSEQKEKKLTPKKIYGQALLKKCYEKDGQPQVAQKVFLENEKLKVKSGKFLQKKNVFFANNMRTRLRMWKKISIFAPRYSE